MHWAGTNKKNILYLLVFSALFFLTRVPRLSNDVINPDAVNWHYRTQQFVNGLKYQQWEKTYQHYHPGIVLMWIAGVSTETFKQVTGVKTYDIYSFEAFDFVSKFGVIFVQLLLTLYIIFILRKYLGVLGAILMAAIFTFEPFFVGNSRLYHLDVLLSLFVFAGLVTGFLAVQRRSLLYYVAAGVLFGLSFLTKSIGVIAPLYFAAWYVYEEVFKKRNFVNLKFLALVVAVTCITTFAFFPALWVKPIFYIAEIFRESERIGLRRGHEQIVFGTLIEEASVWFYLIVFLLKSSPLLLLGAAFFVLYWYRLQKKFQKQIHSGFVMYLALFAVLYFVGISLASKKIDRYIITLFPFVALFAYYGYVAVSQIKSFKPILLTMVALFLVGPLIYLYPFYFTYTSPLFGTPEQANKVIGQKSFGVGMYDLKQHILKKYGYVRLGFIDIKPMEAIYANSRTFDIRETGPGDYDLIVLGINEQMPEKVSSSEIKFVQRSAVYINGLEYWRVYAKQK